MFGAFASSSGSGPKPAEPLTVRKRSNAGRRSAGHIVALIEAARLAWARHSGVRSRVSVAVASIRARALPGNARASRGSSEGGMIAGRSRSSRSAIHSHHGSCTAMKASATCLVPIAGAASVELVPGRRRQPLVARRQDDARPRLLRLDALPLAAALEVLDLVRDPPQDGAAVVGGARPQGIVEDRLAGAVEVDPAGDDVANLGIETRALDERVDLLDAAGGPRRLAPLVLGLSTLLGLLLRTPLLGLAVLGGAVLGHLAGALGYAQVALDLSGASPSGADGGADEVLVGEGLQLGHAVPLMGQLGAGEAAGGCEDHVHLVEVGARLGEASLHLMEVVAAATLAEGLPGRQQLARPGQQRSGGPAQPILGEGLQHGPALAEVADDPRRGGAQPAGAQHAGAAPGDAGLHLPPLPRLPPLRDLLGVAPGALPTPVHPLRLAGRHAGLQGGAAPILGPLGLRHHRGPRIPLGGLRSLVPRLERALAFRGPRRHAIGPRAMVPTMDRPGHGLLRLAAHRRLAAPGP